MFDARARGSIFNKERFAEPKLGGGETVERRSTGRYNKNLLAVLYVYNDRE